MKSSTHFARSQTFAGVRAMFAAAALMAAVPAAQATDYKIGDYDLSVNSTVSIGTSFRIDGRDRLLYGANNVDNNGVRGLGGSNASDDGNLNYDKGDAFSTIVKGVHDLDLKGKNHGFFGRVRWFYDYELNKGAVHHGHEPNNYTRNTQLNDNGFHPFARFDSIDVLDLYGYYNTTVAERATSFRLGRQVLGWGESIFFQNGINGVNTLDVSALRRPGADLKEGFTPSEMALVSMDLTETTNLEAFYQLKWRQTVAEGCGTYFSTSDATSDGCSRANYAGSLRALAIPGSDTTDFGLARGSLDTSNDINGPAPGGVFTFPLINRTFDKRPKDDGQFGFALRKYASEIGTEFGAYYLNYHSRLPVLSLRASSQTPPPGFNSRPVALGGVDGQYFVEYPENISVLGGTFSTNLGSWAWAGQVSHSLDVPVQINFNEILVGGLFAGAETGLGFPRSTFSNRAAAAGPGGIVQGFDRFDITQLSTNFVKSFDRALGANSIAFVGEVGAVIVHDLPATTGAGAQRYGRNPVFGTYNPTTNPSLGGFITDFSWGYRLRANATYRDVFAGIDLIPQVSFAHDVDGWSPEPGQVFNEGRMVTGLGLTFEFDANTRANVSYTTFANSADFDPLRDRDFVSFTASFSF